MLEACVFLHNNSVQLSGRHWQSIPPFNSLNTGYLEWPHRFRAQSPRTTSTYCSEWQVQIEVVTSLSLGSSFARIAHRTWRNASVRFTGASVSLFVIFCVFKINCISKSVTERKKFSIHCFTPQMTTMARTRPGENQEPGTSSQSPTWVSGIQRLRSSSTTFPRSLTSHSLEIKQPRHEPAPLWDAGVAALYHSTGPKSQEFYLGLHMGNRNQSTWTVIFCLTSELAGSWLEARNSEDSIQALQYWMRATHVRT